MKLMLCMSRKLRLPTKSCLLLPGFSFVMKMCLLRQPLIDSSYSCLQPWINCRLVQLMHLTDSIFLNVYLSFSLFSYYSSSQRISRWSSTFFASFLMDRSISQRLQFTKLQFFSLIVITRSVTAKRLKDVSLYQAISCNNSLFFERSLSAMTSKFELDTTLCS